MKYVVSIQHTVDSINKLTSVQYNTYNRKTKYIIMAVGVVGLVGAVYIGFNTPMGILALLAGCWAMASVNYPARNMAKKICEQEKDHMPWAKYQLEEDGLWITSGSGTWKVEYEDIYSLIQDRNYFYVFMSPGSLYMLPKDRIEDGTEEGLRAFLEKKTGKEFEPVGGALRVRKNVFYFIKQAQKKKAENASDDGGAEK